MVDMYLFFLSLYRVLYSLYYCYCSVVYFIHSSACIGSEGIAFVFAVGQHLYSIGNQIVGNSFSAEFVGCIVFV